MNKFITTYSFLNQSLVFFCRTQTWGEPIFIHTSNLRVKPLENEISTKICVSNNTSNQNPLSLLTQKTTS